MTRKIGRDIQHYFPLLGVLAAGGLGFVYFSYDKVFQIFIATATASAYVVWGGVHHYIHKDLHLSVIMEYVIIAALGVFVVFSIIFRA